MYLLCYINAYTMLYYVMCIYSFISTYYVVMLCPIMVSAKAFALLSRRFCVVLGLIGIRVAGG